MEMLPVATECPVSAVPPAEVSAVPLAEARLVDAEYVVVVPSPPPRSEDAAAEGAAAIRAIDRELERRRGLVRACMRRVLEEALHHRSILWRPWREAGVPDARTRPPWVTTQTFRAMSYLDRNFNMLEHERVRWQDGSFGPFFARWRNLSEPGSSAHHERVLWPLLSALQDMEQAQPLAGAETDAAATDTDVATAKGSSTILDEYGERDVTRAVCDEIEKVRLLDRSIRDYAAYFEQVAPVLSARAEARAYDERERARADLEAEEAHRSRVGFAFASAGVC